MGAPLPPLLLLLLGRPAAGRAAVLFGLVVLVLVSTTTAKLVSSNGRSVSVMDLDVHHDFSLQDRWDGSSSSATTRAKRTPTDGVIIGNPRMLCTLFSCSLPGCSNYLISAYVTIGTGAAAQTFALELDTGSFVLAVVGSQCASCNGSYPQYNVTNHLTSGASNTGATASAVYGDGTGWYGNVYKDTVSVAGQAVSNMNIVVMYNSTFVWYNYCNDTAVSASQGIMGYLHWL